MPRKLTISLIAITSLGVLSTWILMPKSQWSEVNHHNHKHMVLDSTQFRYTQKLKPPIHIELVRPSDYEITSGESFQIVAKVSSDQPISQLDLKWVLPNDVQIESGSLTTSLLNLEVGETKEVDVTLTQNSTENQQIHLQATSGAFTTTAQYNTLHQESIDSGKKALKERAAEDIERRYGRGLKLAK